MIPISKQITNNKQKRAAQRVARFSYYPHGFPYLFGLRIMYLRL